MWKISGSSRFYQRLGKIILYGFKLCKENLNKTTTRFIPAACVAVQLAQNRFFCFLSNEITWIQGACLRSSVIRIFFYSRTRLYAKCRCTRKIAYKRVLHLSGVVKITDLHISGLHISGFDSNINNSLCGNFRNPVSVLNVMPCGQHFSLLSSIQPSVQIRRTWRFSKFCL